MSQSSMTMDAEEFRRIARISERFNEIMEIAEESSTITTDTPVTPDDLPEALGARPLGELSFREIAEIQGTDVNELPEDMLDKPLADLTLDEIMGAVESGDLGGAGQTFVACGGSGCAIYSN